MQSRLCLFDLLHRFCSLHLSLYQLKASKSSTCFLETLTKHSKSVKNECLLLQSTLLFWRQNFVSFNIYLPPFTAVRWKLLRTQFTSFHPKVPRIPLHKWNNLVSIWFLSKSKYEVSNFAAKRNGWSPLNAFQLNFLSQSFVFSLSNSQISGSCRTFLLCVLLLLSIWFF